MNELFALGAVTVAGLILGALFFGGLWWTTNRGLRSDQPALWFMGSLLGRTGALLVSLYYLCDGDWRRLMACLIGFTIARVIVLRVLPTALPTALPSAPLAESQP
ncbi:F1F0 ATPase subunit 2 [Oxalobacteraceae bacterium GrIS 2.11]